MGSNRAEKMIKLALERQVDNVVGYSRASKHQNDYDWADSLFHLDDHEEELQKEMRTFAWVMNQPTPITDNDPVNKGNIEEFYGLSEENLTYAVLENKVVLDPGEHPEVNFSTDPPYTAQTEPVHNNIIIDADANLDDIHGKSCTHNTSNNLDEVYSENSDPLCIPASDCEAMSIDGNENVDRVNTNSQGEFSRDCSSSENVDEIPKQGKARKGHAKRELWRQNKHKKLREQGLEYQGFKKLPSGKRSFGDVRYARQMGPTCNCKLSKNSKTIQCRQISEEQRKACFNEFWSLEWSAKKCKVRTLVTSTVPADRRNQKTKKVETPKRMNTFHFHLKTLGTESQIFRVCKTMFLNTLGLRETAALDWIRGKSYRKPEGESSRCKVSEKARAQVKTFLNLLPKMESHYVRENTNRLFLEPVWDSKAHVYREYCRYCGENEIKPVERTCFMDVFEELRISVFQPRKDQCDTCLEYNLKNPAVTDDMYKAHLQRKDEAQKEKKNDLDDPSKKFVYSMDVQAVMVCPLLKASAAYYKTKLAVHNFTIFDARSKEGYCYLWDQCEADLSSSVFASLIITFIETNVPCDPGDEIILWSDGCCYQNRNVVVSNALLDLAGKKKITIIQKYLEKGHTQMECDSMHSVIKRKFRKKEVHLPSQYLSFCKSARLHPKPYEAKYCYYNEFRDYSKFSSYPSIRPGSKKGDPVVADIRGLRYGPDGIMAYKLQHSNEWSPMPQQRKMRSAERSVNPKVAPQLFKTRLNVEKNKWDHIQALKSVLPRDTHNF